jgi:hypothetical protein
MRAHRGGTSPSHLHLVLLVALQGVGVARAAASAYCLRSNRAQQQGVTVITHKSHPPPACSQIWQGVTVTHNSRSRPAWHLELGRGHRCLPDLAALTLHWGRPASPIQQPSSVSDVSSAAAEQGPLALQAGFCHRDVRWANVACSYDRRDYFLLDLEMCAPLDTEAAALGQLTGWPEGMLVGGKYTAASDLHGLGCLFDDERFSGLHVSDAGQEVLRCLRRPAAQQLDSARQLLGHQWFTGD